MLKMPHLLLFFSCLVGLTSGLYKQWIPDTNYDNKTNWDKGDIPCGSDKVQFAAQRRVSVFVETTHAVQEMLLPMDGELILNSGAGFYVIAGPDPGCGAGMKTEFKDSESLLWFDPALWQAAATASDLQHGRFLFSVHEESVPCQQDDVVFKALSSFRVDTSTRQTTIAVRSVSVLGNTFEKQSEFSDYLTSHSGRLQFHGSSDVVVGNPGCGDPTGCICGNSANHQQICSSVTCPSLSCKKPLIPVGHCCEVCGTIVTVNYAAGFNLQNYRERIRHLFLTLPQYESIQLGMSKVIKSHKIMGIIPFATFPEIQVVILDSDTGKLSETLALDIIKDVQSSGSTLGITEARFDSSSGSSSEQSGSSAGIVTGVVLAVLITITLIVVVVVLVHKGFVRMPSMPPMPSLNRFRKNTDDLNQPIDHGFDNPIFDKPDMLSALPSLDESNSISLTSTGVHFVNPVYNENETDFTV